MPLVSKLKTLKTELKQLMEPVDEIEGLLIKAQQIAQGTTKERSFSFKGIEYTKKNLENGYNFLINQREEYLNKNFEDWDAKFCAYFMTVAKNNSRDKELTKLYGQHHALSAFYRTTTGVKNTIYKRVMDLQNAGEVTKEQLHSLTANVKQSFDQLNEELHNLDKLDFVPMPNIESVQELKEALVETGQFKKEHGLIFENGGFQIMMQRLETSIYNCQRIDQKSISCILLFHKDLEALIES